MTIAKLIAYISTHHSFPSGTDWINYIWIHVTQILYWLQHMPLSDVIHQILVRL